MYNNKRGNKKWNLNLSPDILKPGMDSRLPWLPFGLEYVWEFNTNVKST